MQLHLMVCKREEAQSGSSFPDAPQHFSITANWPIARQHYGVYICVFPHTCLLFILLQYYYLDLSLCGHPLFHGDISNGSPSACNSPESGALTSADQSWHGLGGLLAQP